MCAAHALAEGQAAAARQAAEKRAYPVVADWAGPVLDDTADVFYESLDQLAESWWDQDIQPADRVVITCQVRPVKVPGLHEWVEETWATHFDDEYELSAKAAEAIETCRAALAQCAPMVWEPMTQRVDPATITRLLRT